MKIIKRRTHSTHVEFSRSFYWRDCPTAGFAFPCDEHGTIGKLNPAAASNLRRCQSKEIDVVDGGVERREFDVVEPAIGVCACGAHVELDGFTNTCRRCRRDFNSAGQELAPREQWGEETGETADDILRIR